MRETLKHRVLIVHNFYRIPGGEDTVVANEKRLLEEHGHEVVLYTRHNKEIDRMSKIRKLKLPFTMVFNPRTYKEIKRIIAHHRIDIVHIHNTLNLISPAVYYAAVKMGVPVVQTIHNFRFLCPGATFYRDGHICEDCVEHGLYCAVKHKCYRSSRAQTLVCAVTTWIHRHTGILGSINYIVLTEFNREKLLQLKQIKPENVFIKPNFTFETPDYRTENRDYYLYVGRIEEIKGVRLLIEAFKRMPGKRLKLAGQGPLTDELGTRENIVYLGQIEHYKLLSLISKAKAVILPSQVFEGFPMTVPEAFSMRTPMIVGDIGNIGELIQDGYNGMKFKYNDVDSLINTVERFETVNQRVLGENAYGDYLLHYTPDINYEALKSIYGHIENK